VALYALRWRLWGLQANSHDLRASNSLHGVLGLKLAGDGAVRGRLGAIQAAAPTVFRCDTQVMLCSGFDHQSPKRRVSSPKWSIHGGPFHFCGRDIATASPRSSATSP
jgi:hypothetical protein